jgi:uncharacterized protein (TIGR02453 family)
MVESGVMTDEPSFGPELFGFLAELKTHNDRDWFNANKARYEDDLLEPALAFIEDFAPYLNQISPHLRADARRQGGSLFRIYRDTRFSKDKSPYKTSIAAVIYLEKGGSLYVSLASEGLHVGGGSYHLERPQLARLREAIDAGRTGKQIEKITADLRKAKADITAHDAVKTAPRGYSPDHPRIDLLRLGGLAAMFAHKPVAWLHTAKAKDKVVDSWHQLKPLNDWLAKHT